MSPELTLPVQPTFSAPESTQNNFDQAVGAILQAVPPPVKITASPYVTGHEASPTLPIKHNFEMSNEDRAPVNNSVEERKRARQTNFAASLGNTVKTFINRHEEKKQYELTNELTTVMKAQQQIDTAKSILAGDPNNKMAKSVLDQNMRILDSKLSNDKLRKQISKAFDVSFIDPSKNDTPEIKAAQEAKKQVEQATAAGTNADTPQEKALAQMHKDGGNPPQVAAATTAAKANTTASSPGYAEQFLARQPASIAPNPEYQTQLKQAETRDKYVAQYILPKLMDVTTKHMDEELKQGNANARAQFKGATDVYMQQLKTITSVFNGDQKNQTTLKAVASRNWAMIKATKIKADAAIEVAKMRGINGTIHAARMQELAVGVYNRSIGQIDSDSKSLTDLITNTQADNSLSPAEKTKRLAALNAALDFNTTSRQILADNRQKVSTATFGTPSADSNNPAVTDTTKGYINVTKPNAADKSASTREVGRDDDDSSDESTDSSGSEDSAIDNFDIADQ